MGIKNHQWAILVRLVLMLVRPSREGLNQLFDVLQQWSVVLQDTSLHESAPQNNPPSLSP